jgi:Initiator Replication protein
MNDKRSTQISIPLDMPPKEAKGYVMQSMRLTFSGTKKVSVVAKRIMAKVFEQIKTNDDHFKPFYQIHVSEVVPTDADIRSAYKAVNSAFLELFRQLWVFENNDKTLSDVHNLFDTTKKGFSRYDNGMITVALNPLLEPYLLQLLKEFTIVDLKNYMNFKSWYSMQMYEKLSHYKDTGKWVVSLDDYRKQMDCVDKYPLTHDLIKYTLKEPMKELGSTEMAFDYSLLKPEKKYGSGPKPVTAFHFKLKKVELREIPDSWKDFSDEYRAVLEKLLKYKVSESNIVKYAKAIGIDGIKELLKEWDEKERSNKRMDSKEKYCNKVWLAVAKKELAKQETKENVVKRQIPAEPKAIVNEPVREQPNYDYLNIEKTISTTSKTSKKARNVLSENDLADWQASYEEIKDGKLFQGKTFEDFLALQRIFKEGECWVKK